MDMLICGTIQDAFNYWYHVAQLHHHTATLSISDPLAALHASQLFAIGFNFGSVKIVTHKLHQCCSRNSHSRSTIAQQRSIAEHATHFVSQKMFTSPAAWSKFNFQSEPCLVKYWVNCCMPKNGEQRQRLNHFFSLAFFLVCRLEEDHGFVWLFCCNEMLRIYSSWNLLGSNYSNIRTLS